MSEAVMKCCVCDATSSVEIMNQYTTGKRVTKYYCQKHGREESRRICREAYGLPLEKNIDIKKMFPKYKPTTDEEFKVIAKTIKKLMVEEKVKRESN